MRLLGRITAAVFGAFAGAVLAVMITTLLWFMLFWESVPCGATTCDNDGDLLAPVVIATVIGATTSAVIAWWRTHAHEISTWT